VTALYCLGGWAAAVVLILLFNYGAHRNDPPDMEG
jgi:hypothetical protein